INLFDDAMHGVSGAPAESDKRVLYGALHSHLDAVGGILAELLDLILEAGYRVFITSDHGNLAGVGNGLTPPKALVETYARRVILFDRADLADEYANTHGLRTLHTKSLPSNCYPVYLPGNQMIGSKGATYISHGGLSLEELVVPFVEVLQP
ncbi:MAG: hypothetical protein JXA42_09830, partial [Anaerolineales bacterium]|nr:hypothetical protein [Anaerolineales bacterium]